MASQWMLDAIKNTNSVKSSTPVVTSRPKSQPAPQPNLAQKTLSTIGAGIDTAGKAYTKYAPRQVQAGLGWVGEQLSKPSQFIEKKITGGRGYERYLNEDKVGQVVSDFLTPQFAKDYAKRVGMEKEGRAGANKALALGAPFLLDPLNALGGAGALTKIPKVAAGVDKLNQGSKLVKTAIKEAPIVTKAVAKAKQNPFLYKPIEATIKPYFRNPEAGTIIETAKETSKLRVNQLYRQISDSVQGLSPAKQARIGQIIEGGVSVSPGEERLAKIAETFKLEAEKIGKELVDVGLLDPKQYEKYKGTYMHHMWDSASTGEDLVAKFAKTSDVPKIDYGPLKQRKGKEGYIKEFAAPTFKGIGTEMNNVEAAKMYQSLANKFGAKGESVGELVDKGYQFVKDIPKSRGGDLFNNNLMPREIVDYIKRANPKSPEGLMKVYNTAMRAWKAGKTIYNPAYHVRNIASNQILTEAQTGKGMLNTVADYLSSVKSYKAKNSQAYREAVDSGLIKNKYFGEQLDEFLNQGFQKEGKLKRAATAPQRFQQFSEDTAKLNIFTEMRNRGKTIEEAKKLAEEAIFSPYRLNPNERQALTAIFPFYSFFRQSAPFIAKNLVKHPDRFTKYPKAEQAVEKITQDTAPDERNLPGYMREMVRTPSKNKSGQQEYLNTQYFYPWGGFLDDKSGILGLGVNPVVEEYVAQKTGTDPYFKSEFVNDAMPDGEKAIARLGHAASTFFPSAYRSFVNKILPAAQGRKDYQGRDRDLVKTVAGEVSGLKLYPYDQASGARTTSYLKSAAMREYNSAVKRIMKDQSKTPQEKTALVKAYREKLQQRLQEK